MARLGLAGLVQYSTLLSLLALTAGQSIYPPFFNAALRKPVTSSPTGVTCGENGTEVFCESSSDEQSTRTCSEEQCTAACAHGQSWPYYQTIAQRYDSDSFKFGSCVQKENTFTAPTANAETDCLKFTGTGSNCHMPLEKEWLAPIVYLSSIWKTSLTVWIYNELENKRGTLLDAFSHESSTESVLRIVLEREKLSIVSGQTTLTSDNWIVPQDRWTHVGIQLYNRTISVFINGQHATPAYYNVALRQNNNAVHWWIGKSHDSDYDPFVGYIQDFRIYLDVLVNRGINSVFNNGMLAQTRIYSHCLCPADFPKLREDEQTYCIQNPGQGASNREMFRLNRLAHALQYVNDDHLDKSWLTITPLDQVSVDIDLGDVLEVHHVHIKLYSPVPDLLTIEKRINSTGDWLPWQHYSENCLQHVGLRTNTSIIKSDDVICKKIINFDGKFIYSGADIVLDLLQGRPGLIDGIMTPQLRQFLLASAIRVTLKGHPFVTDQRQKYHGISEIQVNATCNCNGHGSDCNLNKRPYECVCTPSSYTSGQHCDVCIGNSYEVRDADTGTLLACKPCSCDVRGTVDRNATCQVDGGQCSCKLLAVGRACGSCRPGFFNLSADNPDGCQPCACNTSGTVNGSDVCDGVTGQCPCKDKVEGLKCDRCMPGYFGFSDNLTAGCLGCQCNEAGTIPGENSCDIYTAKCSCKDYVIGDTCDRCRDGTYNLQLTNPMGCEHCMCNTSFGAVNESCHATLGSCYCAAHVTGRRCDRCQSGYFGENVQQIRQNGCSEPCQCDETGTEPGETGSCAEIGGQCVCKPGVTGRRCDQCAPGGYRFGSSPTHICLPCDCDVRGTANGSIACNENGSCDCKSCVKGPKCDSCVLGYYNLSADHVDGCMSCDCFPSGSVPGAGCDPEDGQCVCLPGEGDPELGGRTCMAYVDSIIPDYGPLSGGTKVSMTTGYLGDVTSISAYLGNQLCTVNTSHSNQTSLNCTSEPLITGSINKPQQVRITWDNDTRVAAGNVTFTYRMDPIINDITPLKTFLSGGIYLTVTGTYLNSVMFPFMTVTMVTEKTDETVEFTSSCEVRNSTLMLCRTPNLTSLKAPNRRKRRQATGSDNDPDQNNNRIFYLGFILDGVERYRNMSISNPRLGRLRVYQNPQFEMFPEEGHVRSYYTQWPVKDNHILIKGRYLSRACSMADYWVQIGEDTCTVLQLHDNSIICVPPTSEPEPEVRQWGSAAKYPQMIVHVGNIHFFVGYVDYVTSFWDYKPLRYGIIGGAAGLLVFLLLLITCCVVCRSRGTPKSGLDKNRPRSYISAYEVKDDPMKPYETIPDPGILSLMPGELRVAILDLLIDAEKLDVGNVIGEGHFGQVHIGFLKTDSRPNPELVAVKALKDNPNMTREDTVQFLEEATMMKDFHHNNVLSVLGVVVEDDRVQVVLPYMENGDLKSFISKEDNMLTVGELIHFGLQIATGMCYLSEQRFVHRDLACRNCMVDRNLIVKVADFGLARDIYEQDYYRVGPKKRPLPVKWMSIESLDSGVWTTKSDVWSYGVVLWELLTRGCQPYANIDCYDLKAYLLAGHRMDRPDYAPDETYSLMLACWQKDPNLRPTFREIVDRMSYFLNEVSARTFMRDKHGQQVPSIANRKHKYLQLIG